jgi:hypothetical protein
MPQEVIDLTASDHSGEDESETVDSLQYALNGKHGLQAGADHEEYEVHLDNAARAQLQTAIAVCPIGRLREVVVRLALANPAVEAAFAQELLAIPHGAPQVVPRYVMCVHCEEEYDEREARVMGECVFHPGMPVVATIHEGPAAHMACRRNGSRRRKV